MSIEHRQGDLLSEPGIDLILHGANCFNRMKSGIAAQIAQKYPEAVEADNLTPEGDENKLGTYSYAKAPDGKIIINLYTQYRYGTEKRQLNYEAIYLGLERIHNQVLDNNTGKVIGIPKYIGCGLAGGNWKIVYEMIKDIFEESTVKLVIVEYTKK